MTNSQIYRLAKNDTAASRKALQEELSKVSQKANKRIVNLRKMRDKQGPKGMHTYALKAVERELNKMGVQKYNTRKGKPVTAKELAQELYSANRFLNMKTSTAKGIAEIERDSRAIMRQHGIQVPRKYSDEFFRFISQDLVQEIKVLDSDRIFAQVMDAIKEGKTIESLQKAWERYEKDTTMTVDVAWEKWSGKSPFA